MEDGVELGQEISAVFEECADEGVAGKRRCVESIKGNLCLVFDLDVFSVSQSLESKNNTRN